MTETKWITDTSYVLGDDVIDFGESLNCILGHTSGIANRPGTGVSWETYWELITKTEYVRMCNQCHLVYKPDLRIYPKSDVECPRCGAKLLKESEDVEKYER